jgi:hypothetical protein
MKIQEFIETRLKQNQRSISWLANEINEQRNSLYYRIKHDKMSAYDMIKISQILFFNLNELNQCKEGNQQ